METAATSSKAIEPPYDAAWFAQQAPGALRSAAAALPAVLDLLARSGHEVRSVVDVGAGAGAWLAVARELGIADVLAIEGPWVREVPRLVPDDRWVYADVGAPLPPLDRRFDMALCLEVAEHLPCERADTLVANLCGLSDIVLFSAAIPWQGGTDHVNLQWPAWWAHRFERHGYHACDVVRWRLWNDERIAFWYRQNMLLFVNARRDGLLRALRAAPIGETIPSQPLPVVHPEMLRGIVEAKPSARHLLAALPEALWRAVRWRIAAAARFPSGRRR